MRSNGTHTDRLLEMVLFIAVDVYRPFYEAWECLLGVNPPLGEWMGRAGILASAMGMSLFGVLTAGVQVLLASIIGK